MSSPIVRRESSMDFQTILFPPETLLAYEYLEQGTHTWRWELATVGDDVSARSLSIDRWLRKGENGSFHTATHNIISGKTPKPKEEEEDEWQGLEEAFNRELTKPLASPLTEEGHRLKHKLEEKQSSVQERIAAVRESVFALLEHKERIQKEQMDLEEKRQQALQELETAKQGVQGIDARTLLEIQSYRTPPAIVKLVLSAVMIILGEHQASSSWTSISNVLKGGNFLSRVLNYDPTTLSDRQLSELRTSRYLRHPRFQYKDAARGSDAVGHLYQWIMSQIQTADVTARTTAFEEEKATRYSVMDGLRWQLRKEKQILLTLEKEMQDLVEQYEKAEDQHHVTALHLSALGESFDSSHSSFTGGEDLRKVWYRPEKSEDAYHSTILVSSVLCELGPSPAAGSTLILEPWQQQRIEEAILWRAAQTTPFASPTSRASASFPRSGTRTVTQHYKRFEGEEWDMVLEDSPAELKQAIINDVADILGVPNRAVKGITYGHKGLSVTFAVEHDSAITKEEVQASIEEGTYPEVEELYENRYERREMLEAAIIEKGQLDRTLLRLQEAKRQAQEAEQQALLDAMRARQALADQETQREEVFRLVGAQTSSQLEIMEEMKEQQLFSTLYHDQHNLQEELEEKDRQLEVAERDLAKWEALLKDQEMRVATAQLLLKEKDEQLQQALENLQNCSTSPPSETKGSGTKVTTHHTAQLEGEEWAMVLEDSPEELHRCFTSDVANACGVPNKAVTALQLSVGSLHAQFSVEHDDTVSEAAVQQQIDEADYSGVLDLYQRRHDRRQQLQVQAELQSALERVRQEKQQVEEEKRLREAEMQKAQQEADELREKAEVMEELSGNGPVTEENRFLRLLEEICRERVYLFIFTIIILVISHV
ncbi:Microtubule-binding stalk of dynein motor, putative [Angomonas deanei]|uniref:Microtubule-binding stalk of dynein motor, putative n=1 Tax=Angomonas deanei TaxID=59799 RepID=A0A7G2CN58_9TRYP|nr:Microtubule-binding stalk of dynein motor, putative [Angomonas deanei]